MKLILIATALSLGGCSAPTRVPTERPKMTQSELTCAALNETKFSPQLAACKTEACIDDVTEEHNAADDACIDEN